MEVSEVLKGNDLTEKLFPEKNHIFIERGSQYITYENYKKLYVHVIINSYGSVHLYAKKLEN